MLYLIPTPIGNLWDITLRAIELLKKLSILVCEDTRSTKKLLHHLQIEYSDKQFLSLTSFSSESKMTYMTDLIRDGEVGLVSDAGTPGLSDPGKALIALCHEQELAFTVLPGPNALIPAVVGSGFDTSKFSYRGFLPKKKGRQTAIQGIIGSSVPVFVYESVHRIHKTLQQLKEWGFTGKVSISRELSKMHEQLITGSIEEAIAMVESGEIVTKGEFVIGFYPN